MGVHVNRTRYISMVICGALAGMGGSFLSLISLNRFVDNITASRGFIALAIVIFGKWDPWRVFFASLLFPAPPMRCSCGCRQSAWMCLTSF